MSTRKVPLVTTWFGIATVFGYPLVRGYLLRRGVDDVLAGRLALAFVWLCGITTLASGWYLRGDFVRPEKKPRRSLKRFFRRRATKVVPAPTPSDPPTE